MNTASSTPRPPGTCVIAPATLLSRNTASTAPKLTESGSRIQIVAAIASQFSDDAAIWPNAMRSDGR